MGKLSDIVGGHVKEVLNVNEDLYLERIKICKTCPLYSDSLGGMCNGSLWINPDTEEISDIPLFGWVKGCGCRLKAKARNRDNNCVINKW